MWALLRSGSLRSKSRSSLNSRSSSQRDFLDLGDLIAREYKVRGTPVPAPLQKEIDKRKASSDGKAKLNLANCGLTDRDVLILVDAIAQSKVVSKLELQRNAITEVGAQAVLTLLNEQQQFMQTTALVDRAHCTFLGHVDLGRSSGAISAATLDSIKHLAEVLATSNVIALLRLCHADNGSPRPVPLSKVRVMFQSIVGKPLKDRRIPAGTTSMTLEQVQALVLNKLVKDKVLPQLSPEQSRLSEPPLLAVDAAVAVSAVHSEDATSVEAKREPSRDDVATIKHGSEEADRVGLREMDSLVASSVFPPPPPSACSSPLSSVVSSPQQLREEELKQASQPTPFELRMSEFLQRSRSASKLSEPSVSRSPSPRSRTTHHSREEETATGGGREPPVEASVPVEGLLCVHGLSNVAVSEGKREEEQASPGYRRLFDSHSSVSETHAQSVLVEGKVGEEGMGDGREGKGKKEECKKEEIGEDMRDGKVGEGKVGEGKVEVEEEEQEEEEREDGVPVDGVVFTSALPYVPLRSSSLQLACKRIYLLDLPIGFALGSVTSLDLSGNLLRTLHCAALNILPALQSLNLSNNAIRRIEGRLTCKELLYIDLSHNELRDLLPLQHCTSVRSLDLASNLVSDPTGLPINLVALNMASNRLATSGCLRMLSLLSALRSVRLNGNPLVASLPNWQVRLRSLMPQLQEIDGRRVRLAKRDNDTNASLLDVSCVSGLTKEQQAQRDKQRCDEYRLWQEARERAVDERDAAMLSALTPSKRLTPSAVQQLVGRLCLPIAHRQHSEHSTSRGPIAETTAPSLTLAVRAYLNTCEKRMRIGSDAMNSLFHLCDRPHHLVSPEQRSDVCVALSGLQLSVLVKRGEALQATSRAVCTKALRMSLALAVKQLREFDALVSEVEYVLSSTQLLGSDLAIRVEKAMLSSRGQFVNQSILSLFDAAYKPSRVLPLKADTWEGGEVEEVEETKEERMSEAEEQGHLRSLQQRLVDRAHLRGEARSRPGVWGKEGAPSPLTAEDSEEEDAEGVLFTDTVVSALRARLAAISVENGRSPDFEDYVAPSDVALSTARVLSTPRSPTSELVASVPERASESDGEPEAPEELLLEPIEYASPGSDASPDRVSDLDDSGGDSEWVDVPPIPPIAMIQVSAVDSAMSVSVEESIADCVLLLDERSELPSTGSPPASPALSVRERLRARVAASSSAAACADPEQTAVLDEGDPLATGGVDSTSPLHLEEEAEEVGNPSDEMTVVDDATIIAVLSGESDVQDTQSLRSEALSDISAPKPDDSGSTASDKEKIRERIRARMSDKKKK